MIKMKRLAKKFIGAMITTSMIFGSVPGALSNTVTVFADTAVPYIDENGNQATCDTYTTVTDSSGTVLQWGSSSGSWYYVPANITVNVEGGTFDNSNWAGVKISGTANLILGSGANLNVIYSGTNGQGIALDYGAVFNIYSQDESNPGTLYVGNTGSTSGWENGITGYSGGPSTCGEMNVYKGVQITGKTNNSVIYVEKLTVDGGTVDADIASSSGVTIKCGYLFNIKADSTVTVTGTATAGPSSGIFNIYNYVMDGGEVIVTNTGTAPGLYVQKMTINDGILNVTSEGRAISGGSSGPIKITGGEVTATGSGDYGIYSYNSGSDVGSEAIQVTGGTVTCTGTKFGMYSSGNSGVGKYSFSDCEISAQATGTNASNIAIGCPFRLGDEMVGYESESAITDSNPGTRVTIGDGDVYTISEGKKFAKIFKEQVEPVEMTGVSIEGTEKVGETLTATLSPGTATGTIAYTWYRSGSVIAGATTATYTLTDTDIGEKISVKAIQTIGSDEVEKLSDETGSIAPVKPGGAAPIEITSESIVIDTVDGYEYSIDNSGDWQQEGVFDGLTPGQTYTINSRDEHDNPLLDVKVTTAEEGETVDIKDNLQLQKGFIRTETRIGEDALVGNVDNFDTNLVRNALGEHSTELDGVRNGNTLLVYLEVTNIGDNVPKEDEELINDEAGELGNAEVGSYLDVSLFKKVGSDEAEKITDLNDNKIKVSIDIPEKMIVGSSASVTKESGDDQVNTDDKRTFYIVRVHDGDADIIKPDVVGKELQFETDRFSTYALVYTDENKERKESKESSEHQKLVVKNKSYITGDFSKFGETGYKYRFKVEDKDQRKIMSVSRKGKIKVKKVGKAKISLFRKTKGSSWTKVEEHTYESEEPELPKKVTNLKVGDTVSVNSLITNKMENKPAMIVSSKPAVASYDSKTGLIKVHKTGSTKISFIYGLHNGAAKYKVTIKIK